MTDAFPLSAPRTAGGAEDAPSPTLGVSIRMPRSDDGARVWRMIAATASLDDNSLYCNLLQCSDFAATCAVAEADGELAGWMSGYIPPDRPDTLFVWQICVAPHARGRGLAGDLVRSVLKRGSCRAVTQVEATITAGNAASWGTFEALARSLDAPLRRAPHFLQDRHFDGLHDTELLVSIGPFAPVR